MTLAYLNGDWAPLEALTLSPLDRGFLFGDGVYEALLASQDCPLFVSAHHQRLCHSLEGLGIPNPFTLQTFTAMCHRLAQQHTTDWSQLYVQVTRGVASQRSHVISPDATPTTLAFCQPYTPLDATSWQKGRQVITLPDPRWAGSCYKTTSLAASAWALRAAQAQGAQEALLLRDGCLVEATANNVFVVDAQGQLCTPPERPEMLSGITRANLLQLMRENGWPCTERAIGADELAKAQECFLTNSLRGICPVTQIDQQPVGTGLPGPWATRLREAYQALREHHIRSVMEVCHA